MGNVMHRGKGSFTHVENTVFFDRSLSLKAKGIYCQIRSLEGNPEWVFTIRGFASLVRDGVDAVTAGIKELEEAGYIIRARKRSENGRFLKAEEATWITLDDPAMHGAVSEELRAEGFAVLSEFSRSAAQAAGEAGAEDRVPEKAQVVPRTGKSVSGPVAPGKATSGEARSGKARSGETAAINYSSDGKRKDDKRLSPSLPTGAAAGEKGGREPFEPYRKGEFPKAFERLCSLSLKPVTSLRFKRDCREAWQRKVESGFEPGQIAEAYAAYAKDYWVRNGDDARLAKNLLRWLEGEDGLAAWADEPVAPDVLGCDGAPRHARARRGGPGLREAVAQGRRAPKRGALPALRREAGRHGGRDRGEMRRGPAPREVPGGVRGALRALPVALRDAVGRGDGKEGGVVRILAGFVKWLFRAVFRFM